MELFGLSLQSIRRKRRSSLLLFAVLFLSFAFAIVSLTVTGSMQKTNQEYRYDVYGEWYGAIANGQDWNEEFLQEQEWLGELGVSQKCATILTSKVAGSGTGVGTIDDNFLKVGRISLQEGRLPESPNEIAVEADLLGYEYTLGQEVEFTVSFPAIEKARDKYTHLFDYSVAAVTAKMTFTLCGILQEYTDHWVEFTDHWAEFKTESSALNGAMVTPEGMEMILQEGKEAAAKRLESLINRAKSMSTRASVRGNRKNVLSMVLYDPPVSTQYIFTVQPGMEETAKEQTRSHVRYTDSRFLVNTPTCIDDEEDVVNIYTWLILGITLLAVVCIYTIRIQDEARQLAIFRSIGITKRQLCAMLLYETLCLGVPAMILGTAGGAFGTWALLKMAVYSGSSKVYVAVSPVLLMAAAALWILGVLAVRLAVFLVALRAPLTGRFYMARKKAKRSANLRRVMIAGLAVLLCTAVLFTAVESVEPIQTIRYLDSTFDFVVSKSDKIGWQNDPDAITTIVSPTIIYDTSYTFKNALMATDYRAPITQIPGVEHVYGWGQEYVQLDFDGMENAALLKTSMANYNATNSDLAIEYPLQLLDPDAVRYPPGVGTYDPYDMGGAFTFLLMVDEGDWENFIDFDSIDREKFQSGESVLLSFSLNENDKLETDYQYEGAESEFEESDIGIAVGDTVRITAGEMVSSGTVEAEVGGILIHPYGSLTGEVEQLEHQYTIICSGAFVEKLTDSMNRHDNWHIYRNGKDYGYRHMFVYVDRSSAYLSTDTALTEFCTKERLFLNTAIRSWKQAASQQSTQKLILLFSGGGCTALVLLLILWNALSLEAERRKRNIGIQQALGMSKKQLNHRLFGIAALRGGLGVLLGWLIYGGYWTILRLSAATGTEGTTTGTSVWVLAQKQGLKNRLALNGWNWNNWLVILLLTALCVAMVLAISYLANRRLTKEDLMAKLRDEH